MDAVASALIASDIRPGENVVLLSPLSIAGVVALFGILRAGACIVPLPITASAAQGAGMARDANARAILAPRELAALAETIASGNPARSRCGVQILEELPRCANDRTAFHRSGPDDPFNVIYSSGTTGDPKGIVYSHALRALHCARAESSGMDERTVSLVSTPL